METLGRHTVAVMEHSVRDEMTSIESETARKHPSPVGPTYPQRTGAASRPRCIDVAYGDLRFTRAVMRRKAILQRR